MAYAHFMGIHPLLLVHSYLTFGIAILFLYQAGISFIAYRKNLTDLTLTKNHISLCLTTALYCFISFLMVWKVSFAFNVTLIHVMWMSGSLGNYFYIRSMKAFLNDRSNGLRISEVIFQANFLIAGIALATHLIFNTEFFVDLNTAVSYKNLFMQRVGPFAPPALVKILGLSTILSSLYVCFYFLRWIRKSGNKQWLLVTGIVLDFFILANDMLPTAFDFVFVVPLIFLTNFIEIARISYSIQISQGKKLYEMKEELIQTHKLSEAGSYYASFSHEVLNPLFAAKGYFDLLLMKVGFNAEAHYYADKIKKQHDRIERLALNVRERTKKSSSFFLNTSIKEIIQDAIDTVELKAQKAEVMIYGPVTEGDVSVPCKKDQVIQVITNILNNAVEAVSSLPERWVRVSYALKDNSQVIISITDSGSGIPGDTQEKIWTRRYTSKVEGAGLGLNICRDIIQNHQGNIYINQESENTEFCIVLPV